MPDKKSQHSIQELLTLGNFTIITFPNTHSALQAEKLLNHRAAFPFILVPVPRMISSGCGLSIKTTNDNQEELAGTLKKAGILLDGVFNIDKVSGIINRV